MMRNSQFGSTVEAILYPLLVLVIMWMVFWADHLFPLIPFYKYGIMPGEFESWKGIIFMPFIHSYEEINHILNNSIPTIVLLGTIIYYYRTIAAYIFILSWFLTGIGIWIFAINNNSYHIGMSGVIYAMVGFLFISGIIRKYKPLQAISLFVVFMYGGLIWGIFPMKDQISWEGHLSGIVVGVILAIVYRGSGPQSPKYLYEVEKEMGIEPPDFERELKEELRLEKVRKEDVKKQEIIYHFVPKKRKPSSSPDNKE